MSKKKKQPIIVTFQHSSIANKNKTTGQSTQFTDFLAMLITFCVFTQSVPKSLIFKSHHSQKQDVVFTERLGVKSSLVINYGAEIAYSQRETSLDSLRNGSKQFT